MSEIVIESAMFNPVTLTVDEPAEDGTPRKGKRIIAKLSEVDKVNQNRRLYPKTEAERAFNQFTENSKYHPGTLGHPKPGEEVNYSNSVIRWERHWFEGNEIYGEGLIIETAKGKDLIANIEAGIIPGFSTRGYADAIAKQGANGPYNEMKNYRLETIDVVVQPSEVTARMRSYVGESNSGENKMEFSPEEYIKMVTESAQAKAELSFLKPQVEQFNTDIANAEALVESLNKELGELKAKVATLESENAELKTRQAEEGANAKLLELTSASSFGESIRVKVREQHEAFDVKMTVESVEKSVSQLTPLIEAMAASGNGGVQPRGKPANESAGAGAEQPAGLDSLVAGVMEIL